MSFTVGDIVELTSAKGYGTIRYKGNIDSKNGIYFGIELYPEYIGKNDGSFNGKQYFVCNNKETSNHGLFVKQNKIFRKILKCIAQNTLIQRFGIKKHNTIFLIYGYIKSVSNTLISINNDLIALIINFYINIVLKDKWDEIISNDKPCCIVNRNTGIVERIQDKIDKTCNYVFGSDIIGKGCTKIWKVKVLDEDENGGCQFWIGIIDANKIEKYQVNSGIWKYEEWAQQFDGYSYSSWYGRISPCIYDNDKPRGKRLNLKKYKKYGNGLIGDSIIEIVLNMDDKTLSFNVKYEHEDNYKRYGVAFYNIDVDISYRLCVQMYGADTIELIQ
eukprot:69910_1